MSEADDYRLLQQADNGDGEALAELFHRYARLVYGASMRVTGNPADAQDVTQQCFAELARETPGAEVPLATWLHTRAVSRARDCLRRRSARRRHEENAMMANGAPTAAPGDAAWAELAPAVDGALEQLPEDLRAPLVLRYLQGCPQEEIAEQLGLSQSTVSRRLEKGLAALRTRLRKAGVITSVSLLASFLSQRAAQAAPAAVTANLGKAALAVAATGSKAILTKVVVVLILAAGAGLLVRTASVKTTDAPPAAPTRGVAPVAVKAAPDTSAAGDNQTKDAESILESQTASKAAEPALLACCGGLEQEGTGYYAADPSFIQRHMRQVPSKEAQ